MEFRQVIQRALEIRRQYKEWETQQYGAAWTNEEIALGFVGDVGDLAKLIIAQNGKRNISDAKEKLAHELSDCLWSVMVLAGLYEIDLESSFLQTMNDLEEHLSRSGSA